MRRLMVTLSIALLVVTTLTYSSCAMDVWSNGTIGEEEIIVVLDKFIPENWDSDPLLQIVGNTIVGVTDSDYWHTRLYVRGYSYEVTPQKGFHKWEGINSEDNPSIDYVRLYGTHEQIDSIIRKAEELIAMRVQYNLAKLTALYFLYPNRELYTTLGFYPFSSDDDFGVICSVAVAELLEAGGIKPIYVDTEYTVPGDYAKYAGLE